MERADKARRHRDRELNTRHWLCGSLITVNGILLGTGGATAMSVSSNTVRFILMTLLAAFTLGAIALLINIIGLLTGIEKYNAIYFEWAENRTKNEEKPNNQRRNSKRKKYSSIITKRIRERICRAVQCTILSSISILLLVFLK